jgi:two-component system sensor histidine kinase QseC
MKMHSIKRKITLNVLIGMFLLYSSAILVSGFAINSWLDNKFEESLMSKANVIRAMLEQNADLLDFFEDLEDRENNQDNYQDEDHKEAQLTLDDYALLWEETVPYLEKSMPEYSNVSNHEYYQMWFKSGETLSRSNSLNQNNLTRVNTVSPLPQYFNIELPNGKLGKAIQISFPPVVDNLASRNTVPYNLDTLGQEEITLVLALNTNYMEVIKNRVSYILLISLVLLLLTSWWIIRYALFKGMSPLQELHNQLAEIRVDNFAKRIRLSTPVAELDSVEKQLNELLVRLEASYKREKLFSSSVAHELRTPICEIRNIAEVALSFPSSNEDDQSAYKDVQQASIQMQDIVDNLLALARLERPEISVSKKRINLYEIIVNILSKYEDQLKNKQLQFDNRLPTNISCFSSQSEMELIFINLIENAIYNAPENSHIMIESDNENNFLTINLSNVALNLTQDDLPLMCDRLWRKDTSRTGTNNSGIGLSLVEAYAEFLGLKVRLLLNDEQIFTVRLSGLEQN